MKETEEYYQEEDLERETLIDTDVFIRGKLNIHTPLRIKGKIEGDIISDNNIIIEKEGKVYGNIEARQVIIAGYIEGDVTGYEKVVILKTGVLKGDIKTAKLKIADGVIFEGSCKMLT